MVFTAVSCNPDEDDNNNAKGFVSFGLSANENTKSSESVSAQIPISVYISIKNASGQLLYNLQEFPLIQLNGGYITPQIELLSGNYTVEDFIVVDDQNTSLYLIPKVGSQFENLVENPLPVSFQVTEDLVTPVELEVIPANLGDPLDFGYATFSFNVVNTLEKGLILHVPFSNNIVDESGNETNLVETNIEMTADRHGVAEMATLFNGENSRINVNNDISLITSNEFTIAAWVRMDGIGGGVDYKRNIIFQQRDDDATGSNAKSTILLASEDMDNQIDFSIRSGDPTKEVIILEYPSPDYGEWHHYVAMLDGDSQMKIYLDGLLVAEREYTQTHNFVTSVDHVDIGIHTYFGSQIKGALNGAMDDFRIYNRALTEREVYELSRLN
ncbi:MAG: hypothetical protein C0599_18505 [Salinivirgaceae bacterium]|nr:MAG: hypothetical protein C0599_18505 [Salinivirgaceae bacterium]